MKKILGTTLMVSAISLAGTAIAQQMEPRTFDNQAVDAVAVSSEPQSDVSTYMSQTIDENGNVISETNNFDEAARVSDSLVPPTQAMLGNEGMGSNGMGMVEPMPAIAPAHMPEHGRMGSPERAEKMFNMMDKDQNGFITKEEFMEFHSKMLDKRKERMHKIMEMRGNNFRGEANGQPMATSGFAGGSAE